MKSRSGERIAAMLVVAAGGAVFVQLSHARAMESMSSSANMSDPPYGVSSSTRAMRTSVTMPRPALPPRRAHSRSGFSSGAASTISPVPVTTVNP